MRCKKAILFPSTNPPHFVLSPAVEKYKSCVFFVPEFGFNSFATFRQSNGIFHSKRFDALGTQKLPSTQRCEYIHINKCLIVIKYLDSADKIHIKKTVDIINICSTC